MTIAQKKENIKLIFTVIIKQKTDENSHNCTTRDEAFNDS